MTAVESYDWPGFKKERKKSFILYNLGILRISRHLSDNYYLKNLSELRSGVSCLVTSTQANDFFLLNSYLSFVFSITHSFILMLLGT